MVTNKINKPKSKKAKIIKLQTVIQMQENQIFFSKKLAKDF